MPDLIHDWNEFAYKYLEIHLFKYTTKKGDTRFHLVLKNS